MSTDPADVPAAELADRDGYDPAFLGVDVPLPRPTDAGLPTVLLPYTHFSVLLRTDRRLACVTAVTIDGATLQDLDRPDDWALDPRVSAEEQTGPALYARNDLDRGHLVRRRDPVWGPREVARRANVDTFFFPNAAPQATRFNQGEELWLGLEDYLLDNAAGNDRRLVVLTGPVLDPADPTYRGVQVPLRFYKVGVFVDGGGLGATGYVLDQTPQVRDFPTVLAQAEAAGALPPLGPFRTFGVPVADVAALTGLGLDQLVAADRFTAPVDPTATGAWRELVVPADILRDVR